MKHITIFLMILAIFCLDACKCSKCASNAKYNIVVYRHGKSRNYKVDSDFASRLEDEFDSHPKCCIDISAPDGYRNTFCGTCSYSY